jgi:hypothetical protein
LHADAGIGLRVEVGRTPKHLSADLILLEMVRWGVQSMVGQILKQLAERLRALQQRTPEQSVKLPKTFFTIGVSWFRGAGM